VKKLTANAKSHDILINENILTHLFTSGICGSFNVGIFFQGWPSCVWPRTFSFSFWDCGC